MYAWLGPVSLINWNGIWTGMWNGLVEWYDHSYIETCLCCDRTPGPAPSYSN